MDIGVVGIYFTDGEMEASKAGGVRAAFAGPSAPLGPAWDDQDIGGIYTACPRP